MGAVMAWVSGTPKRAGPDDGHRLQHRGHAGAEALPGPAALGHAGQGHASGQGHPEAARRRRPGGEEGHDGDVRRSRGNRWGRGRHPATVASPPSRVGPRWS